MEQRFTPEVVAMLVEAGWYRGRLVDTQPYVDAWESRGMWYPSLAIELCREFGELKFKHRPYSDVGGVLEFDFTQIDPVLGVLGIDDQIFSWYLELAHHRLCPIGRNRSNMTLFIDMNTAVYGGLDDRIYFFAEKFDSALEMICAGRQAACIGAQDEPIIPGTEIGRGQIIACRAVGYPSDFRVNFVVIDPVLDLPASADLTTLRNEGVPLRVEDLPALGDVWEAVATGVDDRGVLELRPHPSLVAKWWRRLHVK